MTGAHYEIEHLSHYRYTASAQQCVMLLCLKPREDQGQQLLRFEIETQPSSCLNPETDCFGNTRHVINIHRAHEALEITTHSSVVTAPAPTLPERLGDGAWEEVRALGKSAAEWDFAHPSALARPSPALAAFVERLRIEPGRDPLGSVLQLSQTLHSNLRYIPGSTSAQSPIEHILETGEGVCQDYAHVMIAIARTWGIPTRYVSGFLHLAGESGEQAPDNATHAWVECRLPELGWIGLDPTNLSIAGEGHIRIAVGRDYRDVSPTRGVLHGGGEIQLDVDVRVRDGEQHSDRKVSATVPVNAGAALPSIPQRAIL